ncbi:MAG: uroporphyrinogen decarboxylase family protein [Candidatus Bathyarchaeia archaeon]
MNAKERIMAVLHHEEPDRIPWTIYSGLLPRGQDERELRNLGLGLWVSCPVCKVETPNVKVEVSDQGGVTTRIYRTPAGSVYSRHRTDVGVVGTAWTVEHMVKRPEDYAAAKFIVEDTVYRPDYTAMLEAQRMLGGDGVVVAWVGRSPLQRMLIELLGYTRWAIDQYRHPKEFNELLEAIEREEQQLYRIAAESPAEVVWCGDNMNGEVTSPKLFEKYCAPFYNKQARMLHKHGKILAVHMDGRIASLLDVIGTTEIDVVEAFTPQPMGDLPPEKAKKAWGDRFTIWMNFPETVCLLGVDTLREYTSQLLKAIAPGEGFMLGVTENIPVDILGPSLRAVTETIYEKGTYPLKP